MYQLAHVANTILFRAKNEDMAISPMKLQKLIYFLYAEYLYSEADHLFAERFEAWKYGPVLDDIYQAFKKYGANRIRKYMPDANGLYQIIDIDSDSRFKMCFDKVWYTYATKTGIELSKITHQEFSAWYSAVRAGNTFLKDDDILREMRHRNNDQGAERESTC